MSYIKIEDVSIYFGGLMALSHINLEMERGEIFTIIGPNGAGKTTLVNCVSGLYKYHGEIFFKGKQLSGLSPHRIAGLGISRTFQNIELFKNSTVLQNLLVGRFIKRKTNVLSECLFFPSVTKQELNDRGKVEEILDLLEIQAYRDKLVSTLPYGILKLVEIGRALAMEPELIILDEPTSGLNTDETEDLTWWITDIKEEMGISIILIEHDMRVVMSISDKICVLDHGSVIAVGDRDQIKNDPKVREAYIGEKTLA